MSPTSHVRASTQQVLAVTPLTEVEDVLSEKGMTVDRAMASSNPPASCANSEITVPSIWTFVPEIYPSMTTTFKHLKSHQAPSTMNMTMTLTMAPAVTTIVVNCIPMVDEQVAPVIRSEPPSVMTRPEDPHAGCPTYGKVIIPVKSRPAATCVPIGDGLLPTGMIRPTPVQILAMATLTKVEDVLPEEASTISDAMRLRPPACCAHYIPSVSRVWTIIPEEETSMTTVFKELQSHPAPWSMHIWPRLVTAPTV
jgi:hypothetical protein